MDDREREDWQRKVLQIDREIGGLLGARASLFCAVDGDLGDSNVLEAMHEKLGERFPERSLPKLVHEIQAACRNARTPARVVVVGGDELVAAAKNRFGESAIFEATDNLENAWSKVENEQLDYAFVVLENSREGLIESVVTTLARTSLRIFEHHFVLIEGEKCRAIAVGRKHSARTGADITMLFVSIDDGTGVLMNLLRPIAEKGVNLRKIQSGVQIGSRSEQELPTQSLWLEIDGHITDRRVAAAVDELRRSVRSLKILGSFPSKS
jgi:prephenate dehydratase